MIQWTRLLCAITVGTLINLNFDRESDSEPESKETDPLTGLHSQVDEVWYYIDVKIILLVAKYF